MFGDIIGILDSSYNTFVFKSILFKYWFILLCKI